MRTSSWICCGMILGVALTGCSSDPCDGQSGTCVSARVEGSVKGLDQLRVTVGGLTGTMLTPSQPAAFSLPVKVALLLPGSVTSPASITIDGLSAGHAIASSGAQSVTIVPGARASFTFTLAAGVVGDGGSGDMKMGDGGVSDMGPVPGHVSASTNVLTFPTTQRGQQSAPQMVTLYNRTGKMVSMLSMAPHDLSGVPSGPGGDFTPSAVSPSGCTLGPNGISIAAGVDCVVSLQFTPQMSGVRDVNMPLQFDNGDTVTLLLKGTATPAWSAELGSVSGTALLGVWATTGMVHVVGYDGSGAGVALWSTGYGSWNQAPGALPGIVDAVTGVDATHAWAGGAGNLYAWQGGGWNSQVATAATINGIWAAGLSEARAVDANGGIWRYSGASWSLVGQVGGHDAGPNIDLIAVSGVDAANYVVAGTIGYLGVSQNGGPPTGTFQQLSGIGTDVTLNGVWEAAPDNIFAVGQANASGTPGVIVHCTGTPLHCQQALSPLSGILRAISGRVVNGTVVDAYAVGDLGNVVLHTTGNDSWSQVQVRQMGSMYGVYVLPTGEVYAVGEMGEINHYY